MSLTDKMYSLEEKSDQKHCPYGVFLVLFGHDVRGNLQNTKANIFKGRCKFISVKPRDASMFNNFARGKSSIYVPLQAECQQSTSGDTAPTQKKKNHSLAHYFLVISVI